MINNDLNENSNKNTLMQLQELTGVVSIDTETNTSGVKQYHITLTKFSSRKAMQQKITDKTDLVFQNAYIEDGGGNRTVLHVAEPVEG